MYVLVKVVISIYNLKSKDRARDAKDTIVRNRAVRNRALRNRAVRNRAVGNRAAGHL